MIRITPLGLAALIVVAACDVQEPMAPAALGPSGEVDARSARADCRPVLLQPVTTGEVTPDDCLFTGGAVDQYEDIYLVNQKQLGMTDLSGAQMLTFTGSASFNAIFGVGALNGSITPDPVYAFSRFPAGASGVFGNAFSLVGSQPVYKGWFGGQGPAQLGAYTLTTSVGPTIDTCENGHWVFLAGDVQFTSDIANETSCRGTVQFGPNQGLPLNYQFWYYKLLPGETLNVSATGLSTDPSLVLAAIDFVTGQSVLDFPAGAGDTDRSVSFTATRLLYVYVEISSAPDVVSGYTLTVDGP